VGSSTGNKREWPLTGVRFGKLMLIFGIDGLDECEKPCVNGGVIDTLR
jgi:hypothetical protein